MIQPVLKFDILVSAPNGCEDARELLQLLAKVDLSDKVITLLEHNASGKHIECEGIPTSKIEHRNYDYVSEFDMRKQSLETSPAEWLLFFEDHALPDSEFFTELERYLDQKSPADAMTFYSRNGTPNSIGSRAIYNWVWGEAKVSLYPRKPEPVCSAFLVRREAALSEVASRYGVLRKGELEMQIIPALIRRDLLSEQHKVTIVHFEDVNLWTAMKAVFSNARISGHLESSLLPRTGWLRHMLRRYFQRSSRLRKVSEYATIEALSLELMAISSFIGVIVGRYLGIGNAERELAHAHPEVKR